MPTRLKYDPKTRKKLKPKIKFKGWHIFIVCRHCGKVIDKKFILPGLLFNAEILFCPECALEMILKMFKRHTEEVKKTIIEEEFAEKI